MVMQRCLGRRLSTIWFNKRDAIRSDLRPRCECMRHVESDAAEVPRVEPVVGLKLSELETRAATPLSRVDNVPLDWPGLIPGALSL